MRYVRRKDCKTPTWDIEYTPEEQGRIDDHRRNLRLKTARDSMLRSNERYARLRAEHAESLIERKRGEVVN